MAYSLAVNRQWILAGAWVFVASVSAPTAARAQAATARGDAGAPSGTRMATPGQQALARAGTAYAARDWAAALTAFRAAQGHAEQRVQGTLGVAHCLAQQGSGDGALAAFREAVTESTQPSVTPADRARALQALATQLEAMGRWDEAVSGWEAWVAFIEAHSSEGSVEIGRTRIQVIRSRADRERVEAQVRARIEERRRHNAQHHGGHGGQGGS